MANVLDQYVAKTVLVVTADGRVVVGTLRGFDQTTNLILEDSHERVFSTAQSVQVVQLGLYVVRGDNVACVGELDEDLDSKLDLNRIRAAPLTEIWPSTTM